MNSITPPSSSSSTSSPASSGGTGALEPRRGPEAPAGAWVASTYFAEGFPYSVVVNLADLFFVAYGASLQAIGLTSLFHLPWNLKAFVGPLLDAYETKRRWLVGVEILLSLALLVFALSTTTSSVIAAASVMFLVLAVLSSVHDIAIDGLYLEALPGDAQEKYVGIRAPFWRFAAFVVTGPVAFVCDKQGWTVGFVVVAAIMGALTIFHALFLPRVERRRRPLSALFRGGLSASGRLLLKLLVVVVVVVAGRSALVNGGYAALLALLTGLSPRLAKQVDALGVADWIGLLLLVVLGTLLLFLGRIRRAIESSTSTYASSFVSFLAQPHAGRILAYIVLFRVGESFLMKMKVPFTRTLLHVSQAEFSVVNGTIGMLVGLIAPVVGGLLIAKFGFRRCIWPFLWAQNGLHLVFAAAAFFADDIVAMQHPLVAVVAGLKVVPLVDVRIVVVTLVIVVETIGAGLGTAAFMVFIIRSCLPEHKAAHMALLTSLMSISFTLAGVFSGWIAEAVGFGWYFTFTFVVTLPGMVLTWFVPHIAERGAPPERA